MASPSPSATVRARSSTGHILVPQDPSRLVQNASKLRNHRPGDAAGGLALPVTSCAGRPARRPSARPLLFATASSFWQPRDVGGRMLPPALGPVPVCFQPAADATPVAAMMGSGMYRTPSPVTRGQRQLLEVE